MIQLYRLFILLVMKRKSVSARLSSRSVSSFVTNLKIVKNNNVVLFIGINRSVNYLQFAIVVKCSYSSFGSTLVVLAFCHGESKVALKRMTWKCNVIWSSFSLTTKKNLSVPQPTLKLDCFPSVIQFDFPFREGEFHWAHTLILMGGWLPWMMVLLFLIQLLSHGKEGGCL